MTGLAGGTAYTFKIRALNEYGAGAAAATAAVTPTGAASTYASTVLSSGPSVFYRLADTDPGAMADSSGHGATGAYIPATMPGVPGPLANDPATAVSAASDQVGAGNPSLPLYDQPRTLEGWVNTTFAGENWLAGYGSTQGAGKGFSVAVEPGAVIVSGYTDDLTFPTTSVLNDGAWHFIVATSNGTSATVYVDGISLGTRAFPTTLDTLPGSQGLQLGWGVPSGFLDGDLADVAVFPTALTATQVTAQFAASGLGRPPAPGSPAAAAGTNQAEVSWQAPSGADPPVTGYLITAFKGTTAVNAVSVPATATSATVTGLVGGTAYTFKIRALNEYGPSSAAATAAVTPTGAASTYDSTILSLGPSVFYRLADTGPHAMADSSGHGATGAYTANVTPGEPGPLTTDPATAIADNGEGPVATGHPSLPLYDQPRTLEGWVNTAYGGENTLAGYGTEGGSDAFSVAVEPSDVIVSDFEDDLTFATTSTLDNSHWHFIVVTSTGTSATVYVDGVSLGTQAFPTTLDTLPGPQGLQVGTSLEGGFFNGDLADVAVFPAALTATQVSAQYSASGDSASPRLLRPGHHDLPAGPGSPGVKPRNRQP
jgi:hypothetical protein